MNKESLKQYIIESKTIKEIAELTNLSTRTVRYWLKKYDLKSNNKPGPKTTNISGCCIFCNNPTENNKMYCSSNCKTKQSIKNNPNSIFNTNIKRNKIRTNFKQLAVNYKGGKCAVCSYSKNLAALSFHHLDPDEKEIAFSKFKASSILKKEHIKELDKCILLCENCHQEEHYRLNSLIKKPSKQTIKSKQVRLNLIEYKGGKCIKCNYNKCSSSLTFHHIDSTNKLFTIDNRTCNGYAYKRLLAEADKCVLLCHVCHQESHHPTLINYVP